MFLPALEQLQELGEEQFIALVVGLEEHREQGLQALAHCAGVAGSASSA